MNIEKKTLFPSFPTTVENDIRLADPECCMVIPAKLVGEDFRLK